uniref:Uncharacterized protein n=1 Tax=Aegilops tauschii subsp. strangulata TaxID=200361 RepID=A0A452XZ78_AEGTS
MYINCLLCRPLHGVANSSALAFTHSVCFMSLGGITSLCRYGICPGLGLSHSLVEISSFFW